MAEIKSDWTIRRQ